MKYTYFDKPTQVAFCDSEGNRRSGIAYCDEIICGCCGGIFSIEEIYEFSIVDDPIVPLSWIPIDEDICPSDFDTDEISGRIKTLK